MYQVKHIPDDILEGLDKAFEMTQEKLRRTIGYHITDMVVESIEKIQESENEIMHTRGIGEPPRIITKSVQGHMKIVFQFIATP